MYWNGAGFLRCSATPGHPRRSHSTGDQPFGLKGARVLISEPWTYVVKNDQELVLDVDQGILQGHPHWDPILDGSKRKKLAFLLLLYRVGLFTWRKKAKCRDVGRRRVPVQKGELLKCCFLTMPMEWSWAYFLFLVGDMQSPAFFNHQTRALAQYVDKVNLIALIRESGDKVFAAPGAELRLKGLVLQDEIVANQNFAFLGMVLG